MYRKLPNDRRRAAPYPEVYHLLLDPPPSATHLSLSHTYTHPDTAQGHKTRRKYKGHSLTSRRVTHSEALRRALTAHHGEETDTHTYTYTLTTTQARISPLSALSTAGDDEMCPSVSDEN